MISARKGGGREGARQGGSMNKKFPCGGGGEKFSLWGYFFYVGSLLSTWGPFFPCGGAVLSFPPITIFAGASLDWLALHLKVELTISGNYEVLCGQS